jgi:hypothetical protein
MQSALSTDCVYEVWIRHWLAEFLGSHCERKCAECIRQQSQNDLYSRGASYYYSDSEHKFRQKNYLRLHPGHLDRLGPPRFVKGSESKQN